MGGGGGGVRPPPIITFDWQMRLTWHLVQVIFSLSPTKIWVRKKITDHSPLDDVITYLVRRKKSWNFAISVFLRLFRRVIYLYCLVNQNVLISWQNEDNVPTVQSKKQMTTSWSGSFMTTATKKKFDFPEFYLQIFWLLFFINTRNNLIFIYLY